jgi:oxalate decarboxylase/phosphoglucose isomerase-like protein (cupin superfamily)
MKLPAELSDMFKEIHFEKYPFVTVPQSFTDERGQIINIADGKLGDVAVIFSRQGALRANHVHENDWHLSYMIFGSMSYSWNDGNESYSVHVKAGDMIYTPPKIAHKMTFLEESCFIAVAALNRDSENYELDTTRLSNNFFQVQ